MTPTVSFLSFIKCCTCSSNNDKVEAMDQLHQLKGDLLPPANEVCQGYFFTGVCLSTQGGCVVAPGGVCMVAPGDVHGCLVGSHAWLLWGGVHGCYWGACMVAPGGVCMVALGGCAWLLWGACVVAAGGHAWLLPGGCVWDTMRYGATINEWAVRILLECILVVLEEYFKSNIS